MGTIFNPYRMLPDTSRAIAYETDFLGTNTNQNAPWISTLILAGTISAGASATVNNVGAQTLNSGTTIGSGVLYTTGTQGSIYFSGNESTTYVFRPINSAAMVARIGFGDSATGADHTDGAYLESVGSTLIGKTANNTTHSSTTTSYQIQNNVYYTGVVTANSDATSINYSLYTGGSLVWTDNLTTNIPITAGRVFGSMISATVLGSSTYPLLDVDYANLIINRTFAR